MFQILRGLLWTEVFSQLKLWEFLQVNVEKAVEQFRKVLQAGECLLACFWMLFLLYFVAFELSWVYLPSAGNRPDGPELEGKPKLKVIQDSQYRRLSNTIDMQLALEMFGRHTWVHFMFKFCLMINVFLDRVIICFLGPNICLVN